MEIPSFASGFNLQQINKVSSQRSLAPHGSVFIYSRLKFRMHVWWILPLSFPQVIPSTWLWATSGVIFRPCLRRLWNVTPPCLSATMRERSGGTPQQLSVAQTLSSSALNEWVALLSLRLRPWRSCWPSWIWIERASPWVPAGWGHNKRKQQHMNPAASKYYGASSCVSGIHEARGAALPGAAAGPAGHRLVGLSAGLLHGTSGPAEIPQTQGERPEGECPALICWWHVVPPRSCSYSRR